MKANFLWMNSTLPVNDCIVDWSVTDVLSLSLVSLEHQSSLLHVFFALINDHGWSILELWSCKLFQLLDSYFMLVLWWCDWRCMLTDQSNLIVLVRFVWKKIVLYLAIKRYLFRDSNTWLLLIKKWWCLRVLSVMVKVLLMLKLWNRVLECYLSVRMGSGWWLNLERLLPFPN